MYFFKNKIRMANSTGHNKIDVACLEGILYMSPGDAQGMQFYVLRH
jgi:hypothetical protein